VRHRDCRSPVSAKPGIELRHAVSAGPFTSLLKRGANCWIRRFTSRNPPSHSTVLRCCVDSSWAPVRFAGVRPLLHLAVRVAISTRPRRKVPPVGYPDNVLADDEQVVLHRHPHWKRLTGPVLILLTSTALASFGAACVNSMGWAQNATTVVSVVIGVIWLVIVGWFTLWPFLAWATTHFVITDRRVMFRHGLLTRTGIDIPLARINSVEFRHGLLDRLMRTGTLIIESASQDPLEFYDIPRVERVHSLLYHEVFDTLDSEESPS
jgi:membrane protein YdbS with pleckstrin-like domain